VWGKSHHVMLDVDVINLRPKTLQGSQM